MIIYLQTIADGAELDNDCVSLIISRSLLPRLVDSNIYATLYQRILELDPEESQKAVEQLHEAGHVAQATAIKVKFIKLSDLHTSI